MKHENLNVIILAAGKSSRLWPLGHKALLRFQSLTALEHQINLANKYTSNIFVITNTQNKTAIEHVIKHRENIQIIIQQGEGIAAAIHACQGKIDGALLIINAADFFETDILQTILDKARNDNDDVVLAAKKMEGYFPGGYLKFDNNKIVSIVEKPDPKHLPSHYVKLVVDFIRDGKKFISLIERSGANEDNQYELSLSKYIKTVRKTSYVTYEGSWKAIKYPWDVLEVSSQFLSSIKPYRGTNVQIDKTAIIDRQVFIGDNVKIYEYVKISGPSYIGRGSVVGNYSLVVNSMIGQECLVGGYCEVTRSYIGDRVLLHRNYIGDSVLADDILVGGDAILANFRFDKKTVLSQINGGLIDSHRRKLGAIIGSYAKIGVNASIMPGVKIGPRMTILPQSLVTRDARR